MYDSKIHPDNTAFRAVDACGGTYSTHETETGYADGHKAALDAATDAVKKPDVLAARMLSTLHEARRAIGDHSAPDDCYATGPLTGDAIRDLVQCPACSFIAEYDALVGDLGR